MDETERLLELSRLKENCLSLLVLFLFGYVTMKTLQSYVPRRRNGTPRFGALDSARHVLCASLLIVI